MVLPSTRTAAGMASHEIKEDDDDGDDETDGLWLWYAIPLPNQWHSNRSMIWPGYAKSMVTKIAVSVVGLERFMDRRFHSRTADHDTLCLLARL
ncbi:hypothetical protein ACA910_012219 [Epithemia clementina (nom. ined.)]